MIPTKTGAAAAVSLVIPDLKNKFDGLAVRVPTPNVSLVDVVIEVEKETSVDEVNKALAAASNRYLGYTEEPLVSIDFQGDAHSSIVDGSCAQGLVSWPTQTGFIVHKRRLLYPVLIGIKKPFRFQRSEPVGRAVELF